LTLLRFSGQLIKPTLRLAGGESSESNVERPLSIGAIDTQEFLDWKTRLVEERPAFSDWNDQDLYDRYYKNGNIRFDM